MIALVAVKGVTYWQSLGNAALQDEIATHQVVMWQHENKNLLFTSINLLYLST